MVSSFRGWLVLPHYVLPGGVRARPEGLVSPLGRVTEPRCWWHTPAAGGLALGCSEGLGQVLLLANSSRSLAVPVSIHLTYARTYCQR